MLPKFGSITINHHCRHSSKFLEHTHQKGKTTTALHAVVMNAEKDQPVNSTWPPHHTLYP
jgi:hypothetical protein